jgi:hypothetical protein
MDDFLEKENRPAQLNAVLRSAGLSNSSYQRIRAPESHIQLALWKPSTPDKSSVLNTGSR